jgi:hypothetical protein
MNTMPTTNFIPEHLRIALQEALGRLSKGIRDPDTARQSRAQMDRMREENRKRFGVQNIGVDLIREMRDSR